MPRFANGQLSETVICPMQPSVKLSGDERRAAIIQSVRHLFANQGFKGTRTREVAEAAGVSEALLYRHFPTKDALFAAIQESFCDDRTRARFARMNDLEPSTKTLILHVHFLVAQILGGPGDGAERPIQNRMILRSLAEDGAFAQVLLQPFASMVVPKIAECCRAAVAAGDAVENPVNANIGGWLVYSLAAAVSFLSTPSMPVVAFDGLTPSLNRQIAWFALRGLGLHEEAIRRDYNCAEVLAGLELS